MEELPSKTKKWYTYFLKSVKRFYKVIFYYIFNRGKPLFFYILNFNINN